MSIFDTGEQMMAGAALNPYFKALQDQPRRRVPMETGADVEETPDVGDPPSGYTSESWLNYLRENVPPGMSLSDFAAIRRTVLSGGSGTDSEERSSKYDLPPGYRPPRRGVIREGQMMGQGRYDFEDGSARVNEFGQYEFDKDGNALGAYNVEEDWKLIYNMTPSQRKNLFMALYNRGVYHGRKPSTFFLDPSSEGEVVKRLLHVANVEGRTFSWVVKSIVDNVPERSGSGRSGMSEAQANSLIQAAAQQALGRNLRPKELTPAVAAMRGNLGSMPPSEAAKAAVRGQSADEQMAYGVAKYAGLMARALR